MSLLEASRDEHAVGFILSSGTASVSGKSLFKVVCKNSVWYLSNTEPNGVKDSKTSMNYLQSNYVVARSMSSVVSAAKSIAKNKHIRQVYYQTCFSTRVAQDLIEKDGKVKESKLPSLLAQTSAMLDIRNDESRIRESLEKKKAERLKQYHDMHDVEIHTQKYEQEIEKKVEHLRKKIAADVRAYQIKEMLADQRDSAKKDDKLRGLTHDFSEQDEKLKGLKFNLDPRPTKSPKESKMNRTVNLMKNTNVKAANTAAQITAGKALNAAAQAKLVPFLPAAAQLYASTPLGKLVIANLVAVGLEHFAGTNVRAGKAGNAMITAAMVDVASVIEIEKLVTEFLSADVMSMLADTEVEVD